MKRMVGSTMVLSHPPMAALDRLIVGLEARMSAGDITRRGYERKNRHTDTRGRSDSN
jgi:hypothetical protein